MRINSCCGGHSSFLRYSFLILHFSGLIGRKLYSQQLAGGHGCGEGTGDGRFSYTALTTDYRDYFFNMGKLIDRLTQVLRRLPFPAVGTAGGTIVGTFAH